MKIDTSYPPKTCDFCHTAQPESSMAWQETTKDSIAGRTRYVWGCRDINACLDRKAHTTLSVKCAWCGKDMGTKDGKGVTGTSHAMCENCEAETFEQARADALYEAAEERSHESIRCL